MRHVILCDEQGTAAGNKEIITAHTGRGDLHLAFSVYVFSRDLSRVLIQQRSAGKMLWPMIWANTCCSHPREGETAVAAGQRRLQEELGFTCTLKEGPSFIYRAEDPAGRGVEHEYVTTLIGRPDPVPNPVPNPGEVASWKWIAVDILQQDFLDHPELYAPWLQKGLPLVLAHSS
jgi:isopentenyl-diphosphate delta-isomerase